MQTFIIVNAFRQRKNKQGIGYGWHVGALMTPETKWGYDYVNQPVGSPDACRDRIFEQIRKCFPRAEEKAIRKVIGIRY
jgi:hypothetical protein